MNMVKGALKRFWTRARGLGGRKRGRGGDEGEKGAEARGDGGGAPWRLIPLGGALAASAVEKARAAMVALVRSRYTVLAAAAIPFGAVLLSFNSAALPAARREHGHESLNFTFAPPFGVVFNGKRMATRRLPDYDSEIGKSPSQPRSSRLGRERGSSPFLGRFIL